MKQKMKRLIRMSFGVPIAIWMTFCCSIILCIFGTYKWAWEPDRNHIATTAVDSMFSEIKRYWKKALC